MDNVSRSLCFVHHEEHELSDNSDSELRALRVLRGESIFAVNPEEPFLLTIVRFPVYLGVFGIVESRKREKRNKFRDRLKGVKSWI